jgi:DGQHR domain-containing protein
MPGIILSTTRVKQNNQEYLLGIFKISDILKFTRYTEYTIVGFDETNDNVPITNSQVQRKLSYAKVESIANFLISDPQAIFPTNLVVSIPSHVIDSYYEDETSGIITIEINNKVQDEINKIDQDQKGNIYLSIIDGQHRVRGIEIAIKKITNEISTATDYNTKKLLVEKLEGLKNFELPVSFFLDPVLEYQAMIFSTINRTQTKVSQDLVYSLFGLTENDSPQKTSLNIVNALNGAKNSPFHKRIRLAGANSKAGREFYADGYPILSQATMVKSVLFMICKNSSIAEIERNKSRKYFKQNPDVNLHFREYYADNEDVKMVKIINSFFNAVKNTFVAPDETSYWSFKENNLRKPNNILQTTIGYEALLEILKKILDEVEIDESRFNSETYCRYLIKAKTLDIKDDNDPKKYPFANRTKKVFIDDMISLIWN